MINTIASLFKYGFFVNALIIGILISLCAALLGISLVLKRYSMIGDGLSHVGFGATAVAVAVGVAPLYVSVPVVIVAAFLLLKLDNISKIKGDAGIALISSSALAIGYTVIKLTNSGNIDISNYMFGSIYTVNTTDTVITVVLSLIVLILYAVFYNKLFCVTFDEEFAKATGIKTSFYNSLLACLTAITVVIGMRMMGALLISSLIIFPVLSASRVCKSYKSVILSSAAISVGCFVIGLVLSVILETSPGSSVVISNLVVFVILSAAGKIFKLN